MKYKRRAKFQKSIQWLLKVGDINCHKFNASVKIGDIFTLATEFYVCCLETVVGAGTTGGSYICFISGSDKTNTRQVTSLAQMRYSEFKNNLQIQKDFSDITISNSTEYTNENGEVYKIVDGKYNVDMHNDRIVIEVISDVFFSGSTLGKNLFISRHLMKTIANYHL